MARRETSHDIDQAAADWAARQDRAPLSPQDEHDLQAWLNHDPRSRGALLRAQAVSMMSESAQALGSHFDPTDFADPRSTAGLSRRHALTWGGIAAATVASAGVIGFAMPAWGAITTKRGEIRLVPLEDGSTVILNTDTSIKVDYGTAERRVRLLRGEAYFTVVSDRKRPFVVEVAGRRLRADHAAFRVRKLGDMPVDVLVELGRIDLPPVAAATQSALTVLANNRLVLPQDAAPPVPQPVPPALITRELAWREGKLAFEGETLAQVAATFARYSDTRIVIPDPILAREPVTGLFDAHDPAGFTAAIASVFDARARRDGDAIVLTRITTAAS
jgi:transmembrane sensor